MHQDTPKKRRRRRTYSKQFKAELVAQCMDANISLASLAIENDINPNVLRRWVIEHERYGQHMLSDDGDESAYPLDTVADSQQAFIPVRARPHSTSIGQPHDIGNRTQDGIPDIRLQLQGRGISVSLSWPSAQASALAHWLRDILA